ncbi:MFS transporter [Pseudonocardia kongjuensis]|uniref:MFS transporter n=1 Tax=Pseudonocardia kongjuensis TaxID=102227 RepID=A0ABP4IEZ1_9PSEU
MTDPTTTDTDSATMPPPRAGPRAWVGLAVLMLPLLLIALDNSVLALAAPALSADLAASATQQLWILDIYPLLIAGFLITMGTLGDRIGRRRLLLIGAAAFALASLAAAYAPTAEALIAGRALLGLAGATLMPSTLGLIRTLFPDPVQRTSAIAIWMAAFIVGGAAGPLIGGLLLEHFWWGSVFLIGVPVMAVLLLLGPWLLPEARDPDPGRIDLASVALSLAAMLPLVYGLKQLASGGSLPVAVAAIALGAGAGIAFVRRQRRLRHPLLDLALFTVSAVTAALMVLLLTQIVMTGTFFLFPQYLQSVLGQSALHAALWMVPLIGASLVASLLAPRLAGRLGRAQVVTAGSLVAALGVTLLAAAAATSLFGLLVAGSVLLAFGATPIGVVATDLVLGHAPPERAGTAGSLSETSSELGAGLGIALLGSIVAGLYRAGVTDTLPADLPPQAADAARDTVAGAAAAAEHFPPGLADALLEPTRAAFSTGLVVAWLAGAAVMTGVAVLAATRLQRSTRPVRTDTGNQRQDEEQRC